jgi:hypothetical protein
VEGGAGKEPGVYKIFRERGRENGDEAMRRAIGSVRVIEGEDEWSKIRCIVCDRQPFYKTL